MEEEVNDKGEEEDDEENELEVIHAGLAGHVLFPLPARCASILCYPICKKPQSQSLV